MDAKSIHYRNMDTQLRTKAVATILVQIRPRPFPTPQSKSMDLSHLFHPSCLFLMYLTNNVPNKPFSTYMYKELVQGTFVLMNQSLRRNGNL